MRRRWRSLDVARAGMAGLALLGMAVSSVRAEPSDQVEQRRQEIQRGYNQQLQQRGPAPQAPRPAPPPAVARPAPQPQYRQPNYSDGRYEQRRDFDRRREFEYRHEGERYRHRPYFGGPPVVFEDDEGFRPGGFGRACATSRGVCYVRRPQPLGSGCRCEIPGFGLKRGNIEG